MKVFLPMPDEAELSDVMTKGQFVPFDPVFLRANEVGANALPPRNWPKGAIDATLCFTMAE